MSAIENIEHSTVQILAIYLLEAEIEQQPMRTAPTCSSAG